jgi:hypothetical protein
MANATIEQRISTPIKEPNICSAMVSETDSSFAAFPMKKNGDRKNGPIRPGTLGQANANA